MMSNRRISHPRPLSGVQAAQGTETLRKTSSGIAGLDEVLRGGLPAGRTALLVGGPGCGKTIFGLHFISAGASRGEPGVYVTFEERAAALRANAGTLGMDLGRLEADGRLFLLAAHVDPKMIVEGDFNLMGLLAILDAKVRELGARHLVLDALDVLLRIYNDPVRERSQIYTLNDWILDRGLTVLLTVKGVADAPNPRYDFLEYMADCTIHLAQHVLHQAMTRRLRVAKCRGSDYGHNEYPFIITPKGIQVFPLSSAELGHQPLGAKLPTGLARLDVMLAGGYRRGASILAVGSAGTGKTTLASTFVRAACQRGERVLFISFEQSPEALVESMLSPGIDLRPARAAGHLHLLTSLPEATGAEQHLAKALMAIANVEPAHVILDAASSCLRMGSQQAASEYLMRLMNVCKKQGITLFMLNQATGMRLQGSEEISGMSISSLIDTVLALHYVQIGGETNRVLAIVKARGSAHSNQWREFRITDRGIDLLDVYVGEGGVLTGSARQEREAQDAADSRRKRREIKLKEHEVARLRAALEAETARTRAAIESTEIEAEALRLEQRAAEAGRRERARLRAADGPLPGAEGPSSARRSQGAGRRGQ